MRLVGIELVPGEDADAVAASAAEMTPGVRITRQPAVVLVEAPERLEIDPDRVAAHLGRDWSVDDLQIIMASYFGFIGRWDAEGVVLEWLPAQERA
jgi:hypothetical protein